MNDKRGSLTEKHCTPCQQGTPPLPDDEVRRLLDGLTGWELDVEGPLIKKGFEFKNYCQTMAFANAVAWIAHSEGHHPDMLVSYRTCLVSYTTHAIGGLSENDFICAAKVDALLG